MVHNPTQRMMNHNQMANVNADGPKQPASDPNVNSLTGSCKDLIKAYNDLEKSVSGILMSAGTPEELNAFETDCLNKIDTLGQNCDKLRRLVERKKDILAVERELLKRNEQELQENPQDYIQVKMEALCQSRSAFQRVLLDEIEN